MKPAIKPAGRVMKCWPWVYVIALGIGGVETLGWHDPTSRVAVIPLWLGVAGISHLWEIYQRRRQERDPRAREG